MSEVPLAGFPGGNETKPSNYRVLLLDLNGKVHSTIPIPVNDDGSAKIVARRMAKDLSAELWDSLRYIERYDSTGENYRG